MSDVSKCTKADDAGQPTDLPPVRLSKQKSLADYEREAEVAHRKVLEARKRLQIESARNAGRREHATGRIVLLLIEEGKLDGQTVAMIRDEVRSSCRSPKLVAAFRGSVLN